MKSKSLVIDLVFDLSQPSACAAFEAAVVGDLRAAQDLAAAKDHGGLETDTITTTLTDALTYDVHFDACKVLFYDHATNTTDVHITVSSLDGTTSATDVFSYAKAVHGFLARLFGGDRSLTASATDETVVKPGGASETGSLVTFTFDQTLSNASHERVDDELLLANSLFGEAALANAVADVHADRNKSFGTVAVHVEIDLGSNAVAKILASSDDAFLAAYGAACVPGEAGYDDWTPANIAALRDVSLVEEENATPAQEARRLEAWALHYADDSRKILDSARQQTALPKKVAAFRDLAKKDGFRLRSLVALATLAGGDDCHVAFSIKGTDLSFDHAVGTASPLPVGP